MSRNIAPKTSVTVTDEEASVMNTEKGKLIFTLYQGRQCALEIQNNRLVNAAFFPKSPGKTGAVYIGKVKNIAKNLNACFVEIEEGEICFLSMKDISTPCLVNRKFDGRILEGDELLVQVARDAQKGKRASVTTEISLSNDCFAIMLGSDKVGFSSKLDKEKKNYLKKILIHQGIIKDGRLTQNCEILLSSNEYAKLQSEGIALKNLELPPVGMIVRTMAGEWEPPETDEILRQFYDLSTQFIRLLYIARSRCCFCCLRQAPQEYESIVRQFMTENIMNGASEKCEIVTDQPPLYKQLKEYCDAHGETITVRLYQDNVFPLSVLYSIEKKLETALDKHVWLKSGGYLVIEPTEALTVIDVNSGKYEAGKNPEEACLKINWEAAQEIALQLRLRNLSGIIIVDFINMESVQAKKELLAYLRTLVKYDRISTTIVDMTTLGLVEITRKKINKPLREQFMSKE